MKYYYDTLVNDTFENTRTKVTEALAEQGFGIVSEINISETFKKKLNVDFGNYVILGACNPHYAHEVLNLDNKTGILLPCNVIIREEKGSTEVAAVDPAAAMTVTGNDDISEIADIIRTKLIKALDSLH